LTAVTCLFIASKNQEVEPLDLETCVRTLCYNKYDKRQFLKKEGEVRIATGYENEAPTILEFMIFYIRMVKFSIQKSFECLPETIAFFEDLTAIVYDLCKSVSIDAGLQKYKPSVLAACLVFLGIQQNFEILLPTLQMATPRNREIVGQVCQVYRHWYN